MPLLHFRVLSTVARLIDDKPSPPAVVRLSVSRSMGFSFVAVLPSRIVSRLIVVSSTTANELTISDSLRFLFIHRRTCSSHPFRVLKFLGSRCRFPLFPIRTRKRRSTDYVTGHSRVCPRCRPTRSLWLSSALEGASRARCSETCTELELQTISWSL